MKFGYSYKTPDAVRHEAVCVAKNKEAVFELLRGQGIRAIKVWEIRSPYAVSKRTLAIVVLAAALVAALIVLVRTRERISLAADRDVMKVPKAPTAARRFVGLGQHDMPVFASKGDAFLLHFARPAVRLPRISEAELNDAAKELGARLRTPVEECPGESDVAAELRGMVRSLKDEMREIVAGGRTVEEALQYFVGRQDMEFEYRRRTVEQVVTGEMQKSAANALFQTMGFEELK